MKFKDFFTWKAFVAYGIFGILGYFPTYSYGLGCIGIICLIIALSIHSWKS